MGNRKFPIARERQQRSALAQHSGVHRFINFVVYYFELFGTRQHKALSQYIYIYIYNIYIYIYTQSCCTYQRFRAPAWHPSLHAYRTRALAHLFQPSQGRLNEPRPSAAQSDHTSQTNQALGVKRARVRLRLPSVSTPLFSRILHTRVSTRPHSPS